GVRGVLRDDGRRAAPLGEGGDRARAHAHAAPHRLQNWEPEALIEAREEQHLGLGGPVLEVRVADPAQHTSMSRPPQARGYLIVDYRPRADEQQGVETFDCGQGGELVLAW